MRLWTGGNDIQSEGNYVWDSTGTGLDYTHWSSQEPMGNGNCIEMWSDDEGESAGKWNDALCDNPNNIHSTLCEVLFDCH